MDKIILLDCTLRDGGYVNDWEFGHNNLMQMYERLCDTGVDAIEIGFIDDRRPFDMNRSIFPDTTSIRKIWETSQKKHPLLSGMIDYGTCDIKNIEPAKDSFIDTIRVIFKEHLMHEALDFCSDLISMGYRVCAQLVSVTTYSDERLMELIGLVNKVKPFAVSMVDTYGLLDPQKMLHIDRILDENVAKGIRIGFHGHNNFQLAYANSIAFISIEHKHDIIVDGTLYGMGKSAGNAPIELIAMYLNENCGKNYHIDPMLESIEESVMEYYTKSPWGYKMFYYLSAKNRCHPSYVKDFQDQGNLSVSLLDEALASISPNDKKLLYDRRVSDDTYNQFVNENSKDTVYYSEIQKQFKENELLIIGPGKNIRLQDRIVNDFIKLNKPVIISINYIPENMDIDYVFVTKRNRYKQMSEKMHLEKYKNLKIIATSNISGVDDGQVYYMVNRAPLLEKSERINDNSLLMLLRILKKMKITKIHCAGFDGYSSKEDNYYNPKMEYTFVKDDALYLNRHIRDVLNSEFEDIEIDFVTYSHYAEDEDSHSAAF